MSQVVNSRRGMHTAGGRQLTRESTTRLGVARPGRLMPEEIYRQARTRGEAIDLLREHGYLRAASRPVPGARIATVPTPAPQLRTGSGLRTDVLRIYGTTRQRIAGELARQSAITPQAAARLRQVDQQFTSEVPGSLAHYDLTWQEIHLHPEWSQRGSAVEQAARRATDTGWWTPTGAAEPLQSVVAHEYGHHVARSMFGRSAEMSAANARRLLSTVRDRLSIPVNVAPGTGMAAVMRSLTDAVSNHPLVVLRVSGYAASNGHELLAEIWQEYSTMGDRARPHIRAIAEVMRDLAEAVS